MFSFWRKKTDASSSKQPFSGLATDMHSHLLPGIDDGSPDLDTSMQLIRGMMALGFKKIITTPHILWDVYPNTTEIIKSAEAEVLQRLRHEGLAVEFSAAAEYFIDDHFVSELRNKTPLLPLEGNRVLVEFSMLNKPFDLRDVLFEMQLMNYQPVIAHPERYIYLQNQKEFYEELRDQGCLFQLNILSLTKYYGAGVQTLAQHLLSEDFYDFAGTDLHGDRHLHALQSFHQPGFNELIEDERLMNETL